MDDIRYNGWRNYATWGVALILDNNRDTLEEVAERYAESPPDTAEWIQDYVETLAGCEDEHKDDAATCMVRQMVSAGLAEVDWWEIHDHYLTGAAENAAGKEN